MGRILRRAPTDILVGVALRGHPLVMKPVEDGPTLPFVKLTIVLLRVYPFPVDMSQSMHRYYYYYGPLSSGRDGQAMGFLRALTM